MNKLEAKFSSIMSLDQLRKSVVLLENELVRAILAIKEKQLEPVVKALRTEQRRSPKFDDISKVRESKVNSVER